MEPIQTGGRGAWPALPIDEWRDTCATLHMLTQIVGKVRLAQAPHVNHWWQVPLYVTPTGLTTTSMPHGVRAFQIDFDFVAHRLIVRASGGEERSLELAPRAVADFYEEFTEALSALDLGVKIWTTPVEVASPIPFEQDREHSSYDREYVGLFHGVLLQAERVFQRFRSGFVGKCSPVHFFWGSFDLAVTRFSGRVAPPHPGAPGVADSITREAYSHEVSSAGFWPGGPEGTDAIFYSYAYPEPEGFKDYAVRPAPATYSDDLREFVLPYAALRGEADPDAALTEFLESTYEAAAVRADWDRAALERK